MYHEGFELVYQPKENCIYGYWKGTRHNIQNIVFCIYLDKQDHVVKIEWTNDWDGSYRFDPIIKKYLANNGKIRNSTPKNLRMGRWLC